MDLKDSDAALELTAGEAGRRIAAGELSAEAYCAAAMRRADGLAELNLFISRAPDLAEQGGALDLAIRRGRVPGPLAGAPLLVKDNIDVAGLATSAGTPALARWRPGQDAPVVSALRRAGALVAGKTNMHELAFGVTSDNAAYGRVGNPWDPAAVAGGSSGGTAAAIAAGVGPAGLGTDTAGSIRIPAALCGICGLRTTVGRYSTRGIVPLSRSRDAPGPMARRMSDIALLDALITGEAQVGPAGLKGARLGVPRRHFWERLDDEIAPVAEGALARLAEAGAVLVELDLSEVVSLSARIGRSIHMGEFVADLAGYLAEGGSETTVDEVMAAIASPDVRASAALAMAAVGDRAAYQEAIGVLRPALRRLYADVFSSQGIAALVFPTSPLPARPLGPDVTVEWNGEAAPARAAYVRNIDPISAAGLPGLSLPIGLTASGMPAGLELDGPEGGDRTLIGLGLAMEAVFDAAGLAVPAFPGPASGARTSS